MELFLMTITTGIMVGGIYALVALGWVLIYKCSGVLNLAMGEMTLIGAYVSLSFYSMGIPFLLAILILPYYRTGFGNTDGKNFPGQTHRSTGSDGDYGHRGAFIFL